MGTFTSNHVGPNSARTRPLRTSKFESVLLLLLFVPLAVSIAQNPASGNTVPFRLHDRGALAEQSTGKSPPTIPDGLRNLSQSGSGLHTRSEHSPDASTTTVPRLDAKPIIDIQVSVNRLRPARVYAEPLVQLGYVHVPHPDDAVCPFFHRPLEWPHTHHIHVVQFGGAEERRTLAFRDFLREHRNVAREYVLLKKQLAAGVDAAGASAREAYANAKTQFIERVVRIALAAGYPHSL